MKRAKTPQRRVKLVTKRIRWHLREIERLQRERAALLAEIAAQRDEHAERVA